MATAWELLVEGSDAPSGSTAWEHTRNLRAGSGLTGTPATWDLLVDASAIPEQNTTWDHLNNLGVGVQPPPGGGGGKGKYAMQQGYTAQIIKEDDELLTIITVMLRENKWPH